MSTPGSLRRRGQSGLTIIELLCALTIGTLVLLPMFGLVTLIIQRQEPTIKSADASKQLRLFRSTLISDWEAAKVIKTNWPQADAARVECNRGDMTSVLIDGVSKQTGPYIAIQTSGANSKRIVYNTRPNTTTGGIDILRRECFHKTDLIPGPIPGPPGPDYWSTGTDVAADGGSQVVIVKSVGSLVVPKNCNWLTSGFPKLPTTSPPYEMCDVNVTVVALDGQKSTIRLYQHAGRDS